MNIKSKLIKLSYLLCLTLFINPIKLNASSLNLKLPFLVNEEWKVVQGYGGSGWDISNKLPTHRIGTKDQYALDFSLPQEQDFNKPILAVADGIAHIITEVTKMGEFKGYGKFVDIDHGNNLISRYAHLNSFSVKEGDFVKQGQEIGRADNTGYSTGTHLHFAMYEQQADGKLIAYKPEPMSGYTNFLAGNWYESDNQLVEETSPLASAPETTPSLWSRLISDIKSGISYLIDQFTETGRAISEIFSEEPAEPAPTNPPPPTPIIYEPELQSQSGNDILKPGETATLWAKFKNTGNQTWQKSNVSLNIDLTKNQDTPLFYNPSWLTGKRPTRLDQNEIKPGETGSFTFEITAPVEKKTYNAYFRPVYQDGAGFHWLGADQNLHWTIEVKSDKQLDQGGLPPEENPINSPLPNQPPEIINPESPFDEPENLPTNPPEDQNQPPNPEPPEPPSLTDPPYVPPPRGLPDTTPPDTIIDSGPNNPTALNQATFTFHSTETNSTFTCELDGAGFINCGSPYSINNLTDGSHTFKVKATDDANNLDLNPAEFIWTIDRTPPPNATLILSDPITGSTSYTKNQTINLSITGDGDAVAWLTSETETSQPLASDPNWQTTRPTNFNLNVNDGLKTVYLWTKDSLDNIISSPSTAAITFDSTPPSSQISPLANTTSALTFSLNWSGVDAGSGIKFYDLQYKDGAIGAWQDWLINTTNTSASFTGLEEHTYYFRIKATDQLDNTEDWPADPNGDTWTKISLSRQVVINEIAWMGTQASTNDEWMELLNTTGQPIDLTGWTLKAIDGTPDLALSGTINPYNFFLLERTADTTVRDHPANQIYTGTLANSGEDLEIRDSSGNLVDLVSAATNGSWFAGDNATKASMERIDPAISGNNPANWETNDGITVYGLDALGNQIKGTAGQTNHAIVTLANITQNTILKAVDSPYKLIRKITVPAGVTLTIEPGVVIKATGDGILSIDGTLIAQGTEAKPLVFTALTDDWFGGDTNYDVGATSPVNGTWPWIIFNATSQNSALDHLTVRYGGYFWRDGWQDGQIRIEGSAVEIDDITVEHGTSAGIHLVDAQNSTVNKCLIQDHVKGIHIEGGTPTVSNCLIQFNERAMLIQNNSRTNISSNQFISNDFPAFTDDAAVVVENSYPTFQNNSASGNDFNGISLYFANPINQDYTLKADLPYTLVFSARVAAGVTLTLEPGIIFKQINESLLSIDGTLLAQGTIENPIVFTSIKDDGFAGDTNNDGNASTPQAGDWPWIILGPTSQNSILNNLTVRHGGYFWREGRTDGELIIENTDAVITNSLFEYGIATGSGIHLLNSNSTLNNTIVQHQNIGWWIDGGAPVSDGSSFLNNNIGIRASAGATPIITNYIFDSNGQNTDPADLLP